jgi:ATP-dependent DNA helicase RecQ
LNVPPYVIFHNRTLEDMVVCRPSSHSDLLKISGVGQSKLDRFGDQFLAVISSGGDG